MAVITVGIIGGTGYTGVELLRLLAAHPGATLKCITSRSEAGKPVGALYPSLAGVCDLRFEDPGQADLAGCDVVFCAAPNGVAMTHVPALLAAGCKVIDLAADFRLRDPATWEQWYGQPHACPELLGRAVYGLPELHRARIRDAELVANPGCYPTAVLLGFAPLLEQGLVEADSLLADAKSGVSGAGRGANVATLFAEVADSFKAYAVPGHRHVAEIRQELDELVAAAAKDSPAKEAIDVVFTPHLVPMIRGIHATLYARLNAKGAALSVEAIQQCFAERFNDEPFIDVMPPGAHPDTRSVRGSNYCRIAVHRPQGGRTVTILAVIDNLVKGAAGQAVQNMNLMTGLPETAGLTAIALAP